MFKHYELSDSQLLCIFSLKLLMVLKLQYILICQLPPFKLCHSGSIALSATDAIVLLWNWLIRGRVPKKACLLSKYIKRRSMEHFWTFLFKFVNGVAVFSPCTPMRKITRFSPLLDPSLNKIVFELWLPLPRISNYSLVNWVLSLKGSSQLTIKLSHRGYWPSAVIWWNGAEQINLWINF